MTASTANSRSFEEPKSAVHETDGERRESTLRELSQVHLGRQAIYDRALNSWGYELFYRSQSHKEAAYYSDGDAATSSVILSAFTELGLDRVTAGKKAFINVAHGTITGEVALPLPSGRVVLEVRDYEHNDAELEQALGARKREGFGVALDDYVYSPAGANLLRTVDYVKLDFERLGLDGLREHDRLLSPYNVERIVYKLEDHDSFQECLKLGYRNFQGRFLFRPQVLGHKRLPHNLSVVSDLLAELRKPNVEFSRVEDIVKRDAALSVDVLRVLGSASYSLKYQVSSISQAVSLLGLREFSKWVTLIALAAAGDKPNELLLVGLIRARASEVLAEQLKENAGSAFLAGLFSVLDALLDQSMEKIIEDLPISEEVRLAILEHDGPIGQILSSVLSREDFNIRAVHPEFDVNRAWLDAVKWAEEAQAALHQNG